MTDERKSSARAEQSSPTPDVVSPPPPRDLGRSFDVLNVEVAKIQSEAEHVRRDVNEVRTDVRDVRDRITKMEIGIARIEVRVDHLPSKGFIVAATITALTILATLLVIAPKLQQAFGTAPAQIASPVIPN